VDLSTREAEVLWLETHHLTTAETVSRLRVSEHTVRTLRRRAHAKIGVERKEEAFLWAVDHSACCLARALYTSQLLGPWARSTMPGDPSLLPD
jgi:DNA-binding CsgD family transcriptional regulator